VRSGESDKLLRVANTIPWLTCLTVASTTDATAESILTGFIRGTNVQIVPAPPEAASDLDPIVVRAEGTHHFRRVMKRTPRRGSRADRGGGGRSWRVVRIRTHDLHHWISNFYIAVRLVQRLPSLLGCFKSLVFYYNFWRPEQA